MLLSSIITILLSRDSQINENKEVAIITNDKEQKKEVKEEKIIDVIASKLKEVSEGEVEVRSGGKVDFFGKGKFLIEFPAEKTVVVNIEQNETYNDYGLKTSILKHKVFFKEIRAARKIITDAGLTFSGKTLHDNREPRSGDGELYIKDNMICEIAVRGMDTPMSSKR